MTITINGTGTITGASTLATTVASPTFTTPNINSAQFATVTGTAPIYPCRAWVNFDGTGTVAIRASGNVSSITDNGTGQYSVNLTTAMTDANFCVSATSGAISTGTPSIISDPVSSSIARCNVFDTAGSSRDGTTMQIAIFR